MKNKIHKMPLLLKIEAERKAKLERDESFINTHLQRFLDLKKKAPKPGLSPENKAYFGHTYKRYLVFFNRFVREYKLFNREAVYQWRMDFLKSGKKPTTYNNELALLKGFSDYLYFEGLTENKIINTRILKEKKVRTTNHYKVVNQKLIKYLLRCKIDAPIVDCIKMSLLTGLRASEIIALPSFEFNPATNELVVIGKGDSVRRLILRGQTLKLRQKIIADSCKTTSGLRKRLKAFCKLKNLDPITFHQFRATYATKLYEAGRTIETISKILGHKSIDTTRSYINSLRAEQAMEPFDPYRFKDGLTSHENKVYDPNPFNDYRNLGEDNEG